MRLLKKRINRRQWMQTSNEWHFRQIYQIFQPDVIGLQLLFG